MGFPRAGSNPAHSEGVLNPRPSCAAHKEQNQSGNLSGVLKQRHLHAE